MWAHKTTEPENRTASFVPDPQLVLPIPAGGTYALVESVWFRSTITADFKARFVFSAGSGTVRWSADGPSLADATTRKAWRDSAAAGEPLTGLALGTRFGRSERWGRNRIKEAKAELQAEEAAGSDAAGSPTTTAENPPWIA
ncbi:hypothetical protein ACLQ3B_04925 [Micromonospora sp. DT53]|uniref:hypothetical protein n=1 Tax=Micromonospora sp. DT53 TaxID=3393444 RepID=UPI003CF24FD7